MKFLEISSLSKDALSIFDEASVAPLFNVGCYINIVYCFPELFAAKLRHFFKWFFFDCLSSCTTSFLNDIYLDHWATAVATRCISSYLNI